MVDWRKSGLQILGTVLASGFLVSSFTIFYSDFYKKPDIHIKVIPNDRDGRKSSIEVTNKGREPATNLLLKITSPRKIISSNHFSTDNMTTNRTGSNTLETHQRRFAQGDGSLTTISLFIDGKPNVIYRNYSVYSTYDQGSAVGHTPLDFSNYVFPLNVILIWIFNLFIVSDFPFLPLTLFIVGLLIIYFVLQRRRRRQQEERKFIFEVMKQMIIVRRTIKDRFKFTDQFSDK